MSHGVIRHGMKVNSAKYSFCSIKLAGSSQLEWETPPRSGLVPACITNPATGQADI